MIINFLSKFKLEKGENKSKSILKYKKSNFKIDINSRCFLNLNDFKIHNKLLIMVFIAGLIPIIILSTLIVNNASKKIENEVIKSNELFTTLTKERVEQYFYNREVDGQILAKSRIVSEGIEKLNSFHTDELEKQKIMEEFKLFLDGALYKHGYTDIFLTNKYGEIAFSKKYEILNLAPIVFSGDFCDKAMYGEQNWSGVFRNSFIGDNLMVLSTPIYSLDTDSKPIGTLNIVLNQEKINTIVQNGIDNKGMLLTNTSREEGLEKIALQDIIETEAVIMLSDPIAKRDTSFNQTKKYKGYGNKEVIGTLSTAKIGSSFVGLAIEVETEEAYESILDLRKSLLYIILIIGCLFIFLTVKMAKSISKPINEVIDFTEELADYNLTKEISIDKVNRKDEIGDLERAIIKIRDNLKHIIKDVEKSSEEVALSSEELKINSKQSAKSIDEVTKTIAEIANRSLEQSQNAGESSEKSKELTCIILQDVENLKQMTKTTNEISTLA